MILYLLSSFLFAGNQCNPDTYFNYRADYYNQVSRVVDKRNPASIKKLQPIRKKRTRDPLASYSKQEKRIYKYITRGSFQGADLDGNGKIDIKITKTKMAKLCHC